MLLKRLSPTILLLCTLLFLAGCSRSKDSFTARTYHRMVSKYNPLFNGEQALLKAEESLSQQHRDDYDSILRVYRTADLQAVNAIKPELEKAIEKGAKVIRQHSMMIENKQRNSYIDDAYLLIGKARYWDREYVAALENFNFIIQEFKDPKVQMRAYYWVAKTETAMGNYVPAKEHFEKLYSDRKFSKYIDEDVYAHFAQLEIDQERYTNAYQLLTQAIKNSRNKAEKARWTYICGQLQEQMGNDYEASMLFEEVIKMGPPYELLFNAQLNQARNYDVEFMGPDDAYKKLEKMLADDKNYENRDIIYYVMAEVAQKLDEEEAKLDFLKQSVKVSTVNQKQKGLSFLWLAEIKFDSKQYELAQAYYDSCYQTLPQNHPSYKRVEKLRASLGKLVANLRSIALEDSLQSLAQLSEKQQLAVVEKIIEEIKEQEERELREQQRSMDNLAFNNNGGADGPRGLAGMGGETKFYFYSNTLRGSGQTAFVQRWGNRKLEDNWRRRNKQSVARDNSSEGGQGQGQAETEPSALKPEHDPQTYLANIPNDSAALATSHTIIQTALLDNGMIYKEEIEDLSEAAKSLENLLQRYPSYEQKVRVWYLLYRIFVLQSFDSEAEDYKQKILSQYPESEFAYLILNEGKERENVALKEIKAQYLKAYQLYESKQYRAAHRLCVEGYNQHAESPFGARFLLLQAYCEAAMKDLEDLAKTLNRVVEAFPGSEEEVKAKAILAVLPGGESPKEGPAQAAAQYKTNFNDQHRYVIVFDNKAANANNINIRLTDFNRKYYPNDKLLSKSVLMGTEKQMVMVSGLPNKQRAERYIQTLIDEKYLEAELISVNFEHFVIANSNFGAFYKQADLKGYQSFYQEHYKLPK